MKFSRETKRLPLCKTSKGCPIEDVATDPRLEWSISQFMKAKQLAQVGGYTEEIVKTMLQDSGWLDDPAILYEAEFTYQKFLEIEAKKKNG